ncbi:SprT-like family protein [Thalassoglobus polymorphus]|uniref:SprT-like family protein n=1 Tax=Thalassoglobus polymorphus TaxID=2527994 RepID=A0A517QIK1_9PLAN|nr:SprT-like family protein [Thalassoglobus polymorphus]QDT31470.1 hypothetical protein Mal48_07040 [Thalassoglobus polymorphus]
MSNRIQIHKEQFANFLKQANLSPEEVTAKFLVIHRTLLERSSTLDAPNFNGFHPDDLKLLFDEYDREYFDGGCRKLLGSLKLTFRISPRMTRAGGKTTQTIYRTRPHEPDYEIAVASTLIFQSFQNFDRPIIVTGLECHNRLEALQRIFEHELIHLVELLTWGRSKCSQKRFQSIAGRFFGHTDHRHQLVTPREEAQKIHGIRTGGRVRFSIEGKEYEGVVNRITKRATVLVRDRKGQRYSDGKKYAKFYVPVQMLTPLD